VSPEQVRKPFNVACCSGFGGKVKADDKVNSSAGAGFPVGGFRPHSLVREWGHAIIAPRAAYVSFLAAGATFR
jgi:hypothetical protein